jgi:hypothetical protein
MTMKFIRRASFKVGIHFYFFHIRNSLETENVFCIYLTRNARMRAITQVMVENFKLHMRLHLKLQEPICDGYRLT